MFGFFLFPKVFSSKGTESRKKLKQKYSEFEVVQVLDKNLQKITFSARCTTELHLFCITGL